LNTFLEIPVPVVLVTLPTKAPDLIDGMVPILVTVVPVQHELSFGSKYRSAAGTDGLLGVIEIPFDFALFPPALTARNFIVTAVPFVKPVTWLGLIISAGLHAVKFVPLSPVYL